MPWTSQKRRSRHPDHGAGTPPKRPGASRADESDAHQGATEEQVGERGGSGPGFDLERQKERRKGGVES